MEGQRSIVSRRRGSITRKGNKFYAIVDLGRGPDGKRRRKWSKGFETHAEADAELIGLLHSLDEGEPIDTSKMGLRAFLEERWLPIISSELSPSTRDNYGHVIRGHIGPDPIAKERLDKIDATKLDAFYLRLRESGGRRNQGLAPKTIANVHALLSSAFSFAVDKDLISRNPARRARRPKPDEADIPPPWTAAQLRTFLDHVGGDRLESMWWVLATTGMRRSEVLGLAWSDVDLDRGSLSVTHTVVRGPEGLVRRRGTKTRTSRRHVALDGQTVAKLREHRRRQLEERLAWGEGYADIGVVFTREDGSLLRPDWVSRRFEALRVEAGLSHIRLHDVRHTWATLALSAGVPMKVVQERLGHASIAITMDRYSHVLEGLDRDAAETVTATIFSG